MTEIIVFDKLLITGLIVWYISIVFLAVEFGYSIYENYEGM